MYVHLTGTLKEEGIMNLRDSKGGTWEEGVHRVEGMNIA